VKAEWQTLWRDMWNRLISLGDPPRLLYFVFVVVGIGGSGAWLSADWSLFEGNVATYAMGIAAAAAVELVLPDSTSRALRMVALSLGIVTFAASLLHARYGWPHIVWLAAACGWLLWILSSSSNPSFGSASPSAATGGDPKVLAGDLSGFTTE